MSQPRRMPQASISATDRHPRQRISLLGTEISYVDIGTGGPIVFLHGNPTSSYRQRGRPDHVLTRQSHLVVSGATSSRTSPTSVAVSHPTSWASVPRRPFDAVGVDGTVTSRPSRLEGRARFSVARAAP